ncbi:MAG: hypothetical protein PWQ10_130 [Patescibacteria group bacterium]|nr:hypothetical protein [Patescibacteria group bacterium]
MNHKKQVKDIPKESQLERFNLGFEYDKTLKQLKHEVSSRISS